MRSFRFRYRLIALGILAAATGCTEGFVLSSVLGIDVDPAPIRPREATTFTNAAPVVLAGDDQTVGAGEEVILNGTRTADADADHLMFTWSQISGTPVELQAAGSSIASFEAPSGISQAITLTFRLTVQDGTVARTDDVSVTVVP